MTTCKNCDAAVTENFCSRCGEPATLKRIDGHYIMHEIAHVLHFEKGILYTVKGLLDRPGQTVKMFITENRSRLVKPILFITLCSLIYTLVNHFFHLRDGYVEFKDSKPGASTEAIFGWIQEHYGYANIIMGIFIAFWLRLFFRKYNYNFFEILILLCFVMGIGMLLFAVFGLAEGLTGISLMQISGFIGIAYCTWAIGQFFDKSKFKSYVKSLFSYLFGMLTFTLAALLLGKLIDLI